jgi:Tol biopolymer transport system component
MIQWTTRKGTEKRVRLTTANSDGGNIHTFDEGWSAIDDIHLIFNADAPMMGFAAKTDGQFNLYVINIATGELSLVLENVQDVNGWVINLNPQKTLMAINTGSSTAGKGALYIRSINGGSPIEVDPDANINVAWSKDGEKLALTSGKKDGKQHFRIVSKDGTLISDHIVSDDSTHLFIPMHWSKCY